MDFSEPPRRKRAESIVPMINVVFLLLIFFLMTSNLAEPEPFEINPPSSTSETESDLDRVLYVDKTGRMSFEEAEGDAAIAALARLSDQGNAIRLRADAELEAGVLAGLLRDLARAGLARVELIVVPQ